MAGRRRPYIFVWLLVQIFIWIWKDTYEKMHELSRSHTATKYYPCMDPCTLVNHWANFQQIAHDNPCPLNFHRSRPSALWISLRRKWPRTPCCCHDCCPVLGYRNGQDQQFDGWVQLFHHCGHDFDLASLTSIATTISQWHSLPPLVAIHLPKLKLRRGWGRIMVSYPWFRIIDFWVWEW